MASSIMDSILAMVTPEMKQALAARLGESPQAVQSGLGAATAATVEGLASKASDTGFLGQILGGPMVLSKLARLFKYRHHHTAEAMAALRTIPGSS